jgi:hypothetical protein
LAYCSDGRLRSDAQVAVLTQVYDRIDGEQSDKRESKEVESDFLARTPGDLARSTDAT